MGISHLRSRNSFLAILFGGKEIASSLMPKGLERKLRAEAKSKHYGKKRTNAYVFGTLRKLGWKPKRGKK